MKAEEAAAMSPAELESAIAGAERELFNLRFQHAAGRLSDTSRLRQARRDLARLLTIRREWALGLRTAAGAGEEAE